MGCSDSSLSHACRDQNWEKAKKLIVEDPERCYYSGAIDSAAHYMVSHSNVKMLQFMYDAIMASPSHTWYELTRAFDNCEYQVLSTPMAWAISAEKMDCVKWLADHLYEPGQIFTARAYEGRYMTYAHLAANRCRMKALDFIVKNSSEGGSILEVKDGNGNTPAHVSDCTPFTLEYFVRHAPSGTGILFMRNARGQTPIDIADRYGRGGSVYFTPQKIAELDAELRERLVRSEKQVEIPPPYPEKRADSSPTIC